MTFVTKGRTYSLWGRRQQILRLSTSMSRVFSIFGCFWKSSYTPCNLWYIHSLYLVVFGNQVIRRVIYGTYITRRIF